MADALDPALAVEADIIVGGEIVALAGHEHVVVAVGADLGRAPGLRGDQRAGGGISSGLGLLAAEPAAHPADLDRHVGALEAEQGRDQVLDLARMLGRADDVELARLARRGERGLAFEVEMLLPAHVERARQAMRPPLERGLRVAARHPLHRLEVGIRVQRLGDGDEGGERLGSACASRAATRAARLLVAATTNSGWPG